MNTEDLYTILDAKDDIQKELYKLYYLDGLSINKIHKIDKRINKYTIKKYLNVKKQAILILIQALSGNLNNNNSKKLIANAIKKTYQIQNSNYRISRNSTKIIKFFNMFDDLQEMIIYLGFITFIKSNNINIISLNNNLIKKWVDNKILSKIHTKNSCYLPVNYKSGQTIVLNYFINFIKQTKSYFLLKPFYTGIELFITTRYKPIKIEIPDILKEIVDIKFVETANNIVLNNFKNKFKRQIK